MVMKFSGHGHEIFMVSFRTMRHTILGHDLGTVVMIFGGMVIQFHTSGHEICGFLSNLTIIAMKQAICVIVVLSNLPSPPH